MPHHISLQRLFIVGVFAALLTVGATPTRAADGCAEADFHIARGFDAADDNGFPPPTFALGDFDGDGRPDLAATLNSSNAVAVLLNDGGGRFGPPTKFATGARPTGLAVGDFNNDGRPDLAVANTQSGNVSVLLNLGGGAFGPAANFAVAGGPRSLAVADFNSDGKPDLAVGTSEIGSLSVLLGDGAGAFASAGPATSLSGGVHSISVADFNSDGKPDIATANSFNHFVMTGDGAGGFSSPQEILSGGGTASVATDLNGDGKADLLLGSFSFGMVVRLGDGAGGFSSPVGFTREGGGGVESIALGDLDGDGKTDAAVSGGGPTYFKGDGAGGFTRTRSYLAKNPPSTNTVLVADFDGDGDRDIAAGNSLLLNDGAGVFEAARLFYTRDVNTNTSAGQPTDLTLGDFNGDGRADIAVSHQASTGGSPTISILLDNGAGGYVPATPITYWFNTTLWRVIAADFNKDGRMDLAAVGTITQPSFPNSSHAVSVSLGNGDGSFGQPNNISGFFGTTPWDVAVGEFNADGNLDLVIVNGGSSNYSILHGNGFGGFNFASVQNVGTRFDRVAVGDFNGDSKHDFVLTDSEDRRVVVLRNNDGALFGVTQSIAVPGFPNAVVVGDFNGDAKPDIAVANRFSVNINNPADDGTLSVLLNDGAGNFAAPVNYKIGSSPADMTAADFDGDGKLDLAVGNQQPSSVYVLSGDGAGAFSNSAVYDFPAGHTAIAAHDFDGDTRADLAGIAGERAVGILYAKPAASLPCLIAEDAAVTEGDAGTTNADVTVRLSGPSAQVVKVNYALRGLPATEGQDFAGGSGTLTFQPGETTKTVSVPVIGDTTDELDESFTLHLSSPLNARLSDPVAKVHISDNDAAPSFSISDVTVTEGGPGTPATAVFTVTLSAPSAIVTRVDFEAVGGTATAGSDFFLSPGRVFFGTGETSKTISVSIVGDTTHEADETFFVNLFNPGDATIADNQGQGTILNDDPAPTLTILDAVGSEASGAESTVNMSVRLSNPSSLPVSVDYATADGTATAGSDYVAATGTVTFNPGQTEKTIALTVRDDAVDETHEVFTVNLSNPSNAAVADGQANVQLLDNDGPAASVNDVTVFEGNSGRTTAVFTVSLSAPSPQTVAFRVTTANGTASANVFPADYLSVPNGFFSVPAGQTSATFVILVNGDHVIEPDETFFVNLSQPQDATIADAQGVGTITNDDVTSVQFSTSAVTANEADGSVQLTVTRVGDLSGVFVANYSTSNGTASDRSDYIASFGTLRFEPNETSKTITVFITNDVHVEDAETFFVGLTGPEGGATNAPSFVTVNVNSDDAVLGPNPIDDSAFFVRQHYRDFLGRDPDADGLAFWVGGIESCGADLQCREVKRVDTSAAFFLSIEFQETGYLAYRMYKAAYGDATSPNVPGTVPVIRLREFLMDAGRIGQGVQVGIGDWQQQLEANKNAYALEFVQRARFVAAFPATLTAEEFVNRLVENTGAALSPEERAAHVAVLSTTPADSAKRAQVVRAVAEDADLRQAELNRAFVLMQYYGYLRRNPDDPQDTNFGGWRFWLDKLEQFNGDYVRAEMVKAFITSIEYRQRFGQ